MVTDLLLFFIYCTKKGRGAISKKNNNDGTDTKLNLKININKKFDAGQLAIIKKMQWVILPLCFFCKTGNILIGQQNDRDLTLHTTRVPLSY